MEDNPEIQLVTPSIAELGDKKKPADYQKVADYLQRECGDADYLILAVDMLLYGGIVPSRLHYFSAEELQERLNILKRLKETNPRLKIYAFSLVMRCPSYSTDDEEPDYYGKVGLEIFLYGQNEHIIFLHKFDKWHFLSPSVQKSLFYLFFVLFVLENHQFYSQIRR